MEFDAERLQCVVLTIIPSIFVKTKADAERFFQTHCALPQNKGLRIFLSLPVKTIRIPFFSKVEARGINRSLASLTLTVSVVIGARFHGNS